MDESRPSSNRWAAQFVFFLFSLDNSRFLYYCISNLIQKYNERGDSMAWDLTADRPIFLQLIEIIQISIISGKYPPGGKLPSVRDLAQEAAVNPNTMQKALSELERKGLLFSQRTSGRFITEDVSMIEELKTTLAREKMKQFLESMQMLGFQKEETLALMTEILKGEPA